MRFHTLFAGFCTIMLAAQVAVAQEDELFWHETYDAARAEAEKTGKPLFVAFRCVP